jgi:hypothetical protein
VQSDTKTPFAQKGVFSYVRKKIKQIQKSDEKEIKVKLSAIGDRLYMRKQSSTINVIKKGFCRN